jgi:hypothetical protein
MIAIIRRFVKKYRPNFREGQWSLRARVLKHRLVASPTLWIVFAVAATGLALGSLPIPPRAISTLPPLNVEIQERVTPEIDLASPLKGKQKRELLKANFDKVKRDADDLVLLAKSLQEDVDKSNEHVLSLQVVEKAEKIEKLAKRIKTTARGE